MEPFVLYLFDRSEQPVDRLDNRSGGRMLSAVHDEYRNTLTVQWAGNPPDALRQGYYAGFADLDGAFQLFEIKRVEEWHGEDGLLAQMYAEHVVYELAGEMVTDLRMENALATDVLQTVLAGTRFTCPTTENFGIRTVDFYYQSALACLQDTCARWDVTYRCRLIWEEGRIAGRRIELTPRQGAVTGRRLQWGRDLLEVSREVDARGVVTALYGRGKTLTVKQLQGAPAKGQRVDFAPAVWSKPANPADKPAGQLWVGDPEALAQWGTGPAGSKRHRFGEATFQLDDPDALLQATWEELQKRKQPVVSYTARVADLERLMGWPGEAMRLGDTVTVIDDGFTPPLQVETAIVELSRDYLDPTRSRLTLGNRRQDLSESLSELQKEQKRLLDKEGAWDETAVFGGPGSSVDTSRLQGSIDVLKNQLLASGAFASATPQENQGILLENTDPNSVNFGALYLGPGFLAVASEKEGGQWRWRTFGTGRGFTADEVVTGTLDAALIKTGRLQSVNGTSWIDLHNGAFSFGSGRLSLDGAGQLQVQGYLSAYKNGKSILISADQMGFPIISFEVDGDAVGFLYASGQNGFTMSAESGPLTLYADGALRLDANGIVAPNGREGFNGVFTIGSRTVSFSGGILVDVQ